MVKRRTSTVPCKVYRYGIRPPEGKDREIIDEQMWLAHRYYNDLIEVERARRKAYRWAREKLGDGEQLKEVSKRLNEERKDVCNSRVRDPEWGPGLRGTCGLYSGTYLLVEDRVGQATKTSKGDPKFRRWDGNGIIGVQCAHPIQVKDLISGEHDRYAALDMGPRRHHRTGNVIKNGVWLTLLVAPGGVRARFAMKMHRPMPSDGVIRWIKVTRRREGTRERWEVHFTVESVSFIRPERTGPVAAIDICWSKGRVGYLLGEDGHEEPVRPHPSIIEKLEYADSIRSIRDKLVNEAKAWAADNIDARVKSWHRMHARGLSRKMNAWRDEGHDVSVLEEWRKRDRHLYQIESGVRSKAKRRLQNDYRVWARRTVDRYPVIVLEDLDLSDLAEEKKGGHARFVYAPSHLRNALANAGAKIVTVPAPHTSANCHRCGEPVSKTYHTPSCSSCGWRGDRRINASRNILARGLVALERPVPLALREMFSETATQPSSDAP